jgi:hypothetical protein
MVFPLEEFDIANSLFSQTLLPTWVLLKPWGNHIEDTHYTKILESIPGDF